MELSSLESLVYSCSEGVVPDIRAFFTYTSMCIDGQIVSVRVPRFSNLKKIVSKKNFGGTHIKLTFSELLSVDEILNQGITFKVTHEGSITLTPTNRGIVTKLTLVNAMEETLDRFKDLAQLLSKYKREIEIYIKIKPEHSDDILKGALDKALHGEYKRNITKITLYQYGCTPVIFTFNHNISKIRSDMKVKSARFIQ